jgi:hypothetical protein
VAWIVAAEIGIYHESAWAVHMQQETGGCGVTGRPPSSELPTVSWKAMAELTSCEPCLGVFEAHIFVPELFTHELAAVINQLADPKQTRGMDDIDKGTIAEFIRGIQKFGQ